MFNKQWFYLSIFAILLLLGTVGCSAEEASTPETAPDSTTVEEAAGDGDAEAVQEEAAEAEAAAPSGEVDWASELGDHSGKTLRIIMIQDPWVGAFDEINQEFTALTGAEVTIDSFGYDATHEKEVLAGASGSAEFDVVVLDSPWIGEFAEGGFVDDLTPLIEADADIVQFEDFVPSFQTVAEWDGEIVGVPFGAYFVMQHYREDLFNEAGLEAPRTIEEWQAAAEYFTDNPDYPNMYGTAMNNQRGAPAGQAWFEYIWNFGGKPFEHLSWLTGSVCGHDAAFQLTGRDCGDADVCRHAGIPAAWGRVICLGRTSDDVQRGADSDGEHLVGADAGFGRSGPVDNSGQVCDSGLSGGGRGRSGAAVGRLADGDQLLGRTERVGLGLHQMVYQSGNPQEVCVGGRPTEPVVDDARPRSGSSAAVD